jgi:hypothetical protein
MVFVVEDGSSRPAPPDERFDLVELPVWSGAIELLQIAMVRA